MRRLRFIDWLLRQVGHDTATGDLAREVSDDLCAADVTTAGDLGRHIGAAHGGKGTKAALKVLGQAAKAEYARHGRAGWLECSICPPHPLSGLPRTHTEWSRNGRKHRVLMAQGAGR